MPKRILEYNHVVAIHPSYIIKCIVEEQNINFPEFANRIGMPVDDFRELMNCRKKVDEDIAHKLAVYLNTTEGYWLNMQKSFDSHYEAIERMKRNKSERERNKCKF